MITHLTNWAGQRLYVGDAVWRGARDGNTSSFKIGQIVGLNSEKRTVKVHWIAEPGYTWKNEIYRFIDSTGSPSIDTIVKIDKKDIHPEILVRLL